MPIHYLHKSVPFEELTAMYALADACLVTSTRDGMNLVSLLPSLFRQGTSIGSEVRRSKGVEWDQGMERYKIPTKECRRREIKTGRDCP
jgi:hypothetical protein